MADVVTITFVMDATGTVPLDGATVTALYNQQPTDNNRGDFEDDECHGDVWHGAENYPLYNTSEIALENGGNEINRWVDGDNSGSNTWTHVDESLDDETNYSYTVKAWNSELESQTDAVLESSDATILPLGLALISSKVGLFF